MSVLKNDYIFVFGYFGLVTDQIDGQTVKTRMVHRLFEENLGSKINFFDTEMLKFNKLSLLKALLHLTKVKYVIYLPAQNNLKRFFPILFFLSGIFNFQIHYFVIGGWLPQFVMINKKIGRKLRKIAGIYVETRKLEGILSNNFSFSNVKWFPNFRFKYKGKALKKNDSEKLKVVYLSRITKKKGIDTVFWFLDSLNNESKKQRLQIDFYGPIDKIDKNYFEEQSKRHKLVTTYKGIVDPDSVQKILSNYDILLFPTIYEGEGCPGIIIDACFAGLPVLASDWKYNSEFVIDRETGFLFKIDDKMKFRTILLELIENKNSLKEMGLKAKKFSEKFESSTAWQIIKSNLIPLCT